MLTPQVPRRGALARTVHRLPHEPASARAARQAVNRDLAAEVPEATLDAALLVVSELVTNALRHAHPFDDECIELAVSFDGSHVVIEVVDAGPNPVSPTRRQLQDRPDEHGRGLFLVTALTEDVKVERTTRRSRTVARIRAH